MNRLRCLRGGLVATLVAGLVAAALTGCGGYVGEPPPDASTGSPDARSPSTSATPGADEELSAEAKRAEEAAGKQRSQQSADASPSGPAEDATIPGSPVSPGLTGRVLGADVSWPQCPKGMGIPQRQGEGLPMPTAEARFVVLGLTNGPGFTANPCLADQFAWAREHHVLVGLYSVLSYPDKERLEQARTQGPYDGSTREGALRNAGWAQARFNVRTADQLELYAPAIWVDVEPYPVFPWSADTTANAQVVVGAVGAYRRAGYRVGFYSTPHLWRTVVGDLSFGLTEWRAAGKTGADEATARCAADWTFQGGTALMAQWTTGKRDWNLTCPGRARELDQWFRQY